MKHFRSWASSLTAALLLAGCGGGSGPASPDGGATASSAGERRNFSAVVSFGDSLSDVGTYAPATQIPGTNPPVYLGGKFTTNGPNATIWVENLATNLGLQITPAEVGFGFSTPPTFCPAAAQGLGNTCTAYGQGGARVTDANGIRHNAGALTVPIKTQIENHLARFGRFRSSDLVLFWAGANDLLWEVEQDPTVNPNSFVIQLFGIQAQLQTGAISPDQAQSMTAQALAASVAGMRLAGDQLAGYIRTQVLARGGKYVAVLTLPNPVSTPEGAATAAAYPLLGAAMTGFADAFNQALKQGLAGQPVRIIDAAALISGVVAQPSLYGMVNASVPACDAAKIAAMTGGAVTDGFSLFCNGNTLRDGADVDTWFFADGNHPTTGGYKLISDEVMRQLKSFGWLDRREREDAL